MIDIYGSHFEYGGQSSRKYGLIFATIETSRYTQLGGAPTAQTVFNKRNQKKYIVGDDYSDSAISFDVEFVTDEERLLDVREQRQVEKWLFNRHNYRKLYVDIIDDVYGDTFEYVGGEKKSVYINCRFTNPEKLEYNGGVVGYKATLEADSSYLWQEPTKYSFEISNPTSESSTIINVPVDSDIDDYIYPTVTIHMGSVGGDIIVSNNTDSSSRLTKFVGLPQNSIITMTGNLNYISGEYYSKFSTQNFPRLLDGNNKITVLGNITALDFEFQNRRFM